MQISFKKVHAFFREEVEEVYDNIWYKNVTSTFNRPILNKNTEQETSIKNIHLSKDSACHSFEGAGNILLIIKNNVSIYHSGPYSGPSTGWFCNNQGFGHPSPLSTGLVSGFDIPFARDNFCET